MTRFLSTIRNNNGSALIVTVLLVPVLTLLVVFAATTGQQNLNVTTNDDCHRDALYNADGAIYGTSKLISLIGKSSTRQGITAGEGEAAPGIKYLDASGNEIDDAEWFRHLVTSLESKDTGNDLEFAMADPENDVGLQSLVDITKFPGGNPGGGGAEFGSSAEGIGTQMNIVVFRMRSQGQAGCPNTSLPIVGDYWMVVSKDGQTKGI